MPVTVVYRRKVGRDLGAAFSYYERQTSGLGEQFLAAVDSVFEAIERYPEMFAPIHGAVRRALVSRFPYAVFYRVEPRQAVVLAVLHTARDPKLWPQSK
jgi:plasmid stabilization system protein ParE